MLAFATQGQAGSGASALLFLLPLVMLAVLLWSARRRNKATAAAQARLQVGDRVQTTSGMFGVLTQLDDTIGVIEVAPNVRITFDRRALLPATSGVTSAVSGTSGAPANAMTERDA